MGFHFLQSKLLSLWKPTRMMDCVNLGNGFFLVRLSLKEDFENVLKKGSWFIGEHLLSLQPREPNFRPSSTNISSVAVWVRLNELPIEYYNAKALHQIDNSISNVLRVNTFIAFESRGRFARLCIQIDVEKPLVTAILIGKFEQPVSYEGIQKLCFGCGRLGHRPLAWYQNLMVKHYNSNVRHRDFQVGDLILRKVMGATRDPLQEKLGPN